MTDFYSDDLSDLLAGNPGSAPKAPQDPQLARIRETVPEFVETCPKCRGTGRFTSWSGRTLGQCFACKGKGRHTFKTSAADRASARLRAAAQPAKRWEAFVAAHAAEAAWIVATAPRFGFAANMRVAVEKYGSLTDGQLSKVRELAARDADRAATPKAIGTGPTVDVSKIVAALQAGKASGLIWVTLRFNGITMAEAKKYPGVIYVKRNDANHTYIGKIADGRFSPAAACTPADTAAIVLVCEDPLAAAKVYGNVTNSCCVCGRGLTNKQSVEEGIGPICSSRVGWVAGGLRVSVLTGEEAE